MTSPPGGGSFNWPCRANMGPANNIDALIWRHKSVSGVCPAIDLACTTQVLSFCSSTPTPRFCSICFRVITSPILGILCNIMGSSVSRQAARIGSAAFLFPEGVRVPFNGNPPLITNCSIVVCVVFKLKANSDNRVGVCISLHTCMNCNRVCLQGQPLR